MQRRNFIKKSLLASALAIAPGLLLGRRRAAAASRSPLIDAYCHFSFMEMVSFLEEQSGHSPHVFRRLFANTPALLDPDARLALMDKCGIRLSVLAPLPWLETSPPVAADPKLAVAAARLMNDRLADLVARHQSRFRAVALLPTVTAEAMCGELSRAVKELGLAGGFFAVGPTVKPPDHPDYFQLYALAEKLDVPLWLHPSRPPAYPDYLGEKRSRFQVWQALSWLMDSSTAMVRLVFNGVFDKHPKLKIIIHHHGALVPLFAKRMQYGWDYFEQNTGRKQPTDIKRPYIEHFKKFYCDTATQGLEPGLLRIAYRFFGPGRMLFGSDAPMDPKGGIAFTNDARGSLDGVNMPPEHRALIEQGNAARLLRL